MESIHDNQLVNLLNAACDAFGRPDALELVERTINRLLGANACVKEGSPFGEGYAQSVALLATSTPADAVDEQANPVQVHGLPDGATWEPLPVELKLAKGALAAAKSSSNGVVLRSMSGTYFYATYDYGAKLMRVPSSFGSSRKPCQTHIPLNGAYRWSLVGVVKESST